MPEVVFSSIGVQFLARFSEKAESVPNNEFPALHSLLRQGWFLYLERKGQVLLCAWNCQMRSTASATSEASRLLPKGRGALPTA